VLWVNCVKLINKKQIKNLVECGPGKVLSGLIKRIEPKITCHGSDDAISLAKAIEEVSV
jgi:[acyl-carrier-protein] S-malonyltransferase